LESLKKLDDVRALSDRFPHCETMLEGLCVDLERQWFMGSDVITLTPALFVGPAGVGKTAIAREIGAALGIYLREANVGGSPDAHIFGLSAGWSSAHAGIITESVATSKTLNPLIVLDEIDKTHASKNGDIQAELLSLLEPTEARRYHERYLKTTVDASHVSWILTANRLETVTEPLKSRCRVYRIPAPTSEQIPQIIRSLVREYAEDHALRPEFFALDFGELNALAATYETHKSVRILSRLVHGYLHKRQLAMKMM
jgi:ATP-dependent Lon protease